MPPPPKMITNATGLLLVSGGLNREYWLKMTSFLLGKDLKCDADIIKEIPYMEKVTPAMLISAQACVAKSMEENW